MARAACGWQALTSTQISTAINPRQNYATAALVVTVPIAVFAVLLNLSLSWWTECVIFLLTVSLVIVLFVRQGGWTALPTACCWAPSPTS